jgi:uncharacterized protein (DUF924 family)
MAIVATVPRSDAAGEEVAHREWREVYDFWFPVGLETADLETYRRVLERWFGGGLNADLPAFAATLEAAGRGDLNKWLEVPLARLSLIIVLDQFPRGLFAGSPKAFSFDQRALEITEEGIRNGHYNALRHQWEKVFFGLPLIHAEGPDHLERADRSVALAEARLSQGPPHLRPMRDFGLSQARDHRDVIARFRRHPHRNTVLRRASTPEEAAYIERGEFVRNRRPL